MSSARKKPKNWKGQEQVLANPPVHQWEVGGRETSTTQVAIPTQGFGVAAIILVCISLLLLGAFVYFLLHSPKKTPLIVVAPTTYTWPYPASTWRVEDAKGLQFLSKKNLEVVNRSKVWQSYTSAIEDLNKQLDELSSAARDSGTVILYLAMLPCVDDDSEPCLIPPEANPLEPEQWIRLKEIIDVLQKKTPSTTRKLIVIDPIQLTSNWHLGVLQSTFVERLENWVRDLGTPDVAILTAASDRETAWSGSDIRSSIFGREFRLGISGEADKSVSSGSGKDAGGNGDGIVTLSELFSYLQGRVTSWTSTYRGVKQTPRIFTSDKSDFPLAWALSNYEQGRQRAELATNGASEPSVSTAEMVDIWNSIDQLREYELYRYDPYGWAQLERKVVELGVLSRGGSAYAEQCKRLLAVNLKKVLTELSDSAAKLSRSNCLLDRYGLFNANLRGQFPAMAMPSMALKELTGELDAEKALLASAQVRQRLGQVGSQNFESIGASVGLSSYASTWSEANYIALLNLFECMQSWQDTTLIQSMIDLREKWERIVCQGEIRIHRWSRTLFAQGDELRRNAEDLLQAGESQEAKDAILAFARFVESLSSEDTNDRLKLEKTIHTLDRAYSLAIPIAQWILQTASIGDEADLPELLSGTLDLSQDAPSNSGDISEVASQRLKRKLIERFRELIENTRSLDQLLIDPSSEITSVLSKGTELSKRIESDIDFLMSTFDVEVSRLTSDKPLSENAIPRIERLLETPFLKVAQLQALNDALFRLYEQNRQQALGATKVTQVVQSDKRTSASVSVKTPRAAADVWADIKSLSSHPVALLLHLNRAAGTQDANGKEAISKARESSMQTIEGFNSDLRHLLSSAESLDASRLSDWLRMNKVDEPVGSEKSGWSAAFAADRIERNLATLSPKRPEKSAVVSLRNASLKDALVWHSQRALEDFYASGTNTPSGPSVQKVPFFVLAVKQIVNFATAIPFSDEKLDRALAEKLRVVDILLPAAKSGFQTSVKTGPPILDRAEHEVSISVSQLLGRLANGNQSAPSIPKGKAVLVVRMPDQVRPISRSAFSVPMEQETNTLLTSLPDLANGKNLQVAAVFRGHEFRAPLAAQRGITIDFEPKRFNRSDVVLFGDRTTQPATVVILDCSWSMGEQISIEAIDSPTQSRLDAAKSSILRMLSQFAEQPDARVGLRLFGHRVGWSRPDANKQTPVNGKTQLLLQPSYSGKIPDDLVPSRDVEAILPLGRFNTSMIGPLADRLATVVPWGQSPLYYAITEAFGDFASDPEATAKCIIVITDGDNFQFAASNRPGGEPASQTSLEDVERAWTRSKVPVFVLGVGIDESAESNVRRNLERLTTNTGGKYYDIQDGTDLVRALSERLSVGTFRVSAEPKSARQTPGGSQFAMESQFNRPVDLPVEQSGKNTFEIEFKSVKKSFQIEGGESLEMQLLPSGEDIVAIPFERNSPKVGTLVNNNSGRILARVHRPQVLGNGVMFPISFQNPNSHYTPRPKELWMELAPSPVNEQGVANYVFYDTPYESGLPVPMVHWTINDWPKGATEADIQVWMKYEATPAKWTFPLANVVQESQKYLEGVVLDRDAGSQLRIRIGNRSESADTTIQVTEIHNDAQFTSNYRISLDLGDVVIPKRVVRRYEAGGRIAVHSFTVGAAVLQQALSSPTSQIKVSTKEDSLRGAWQLQGNAPIRVSIGSQVNTVPREEVVPIPTR